jgi:Na+/alanine symporter
MGIDILTGRIVPPVILIAGIYFGCSLGWFYLLHPIRTLRVALRGGRRSVSALGLALAGTLGVGNVIGVAAAISGGGAGAVFWMWVSAFLAMALKYAEISLALRHGRRDGNGMLRGSAMYYISDCFSSRGHRLVGGLLSSVFALLLVLTSLTMGSALQTSAAAEGMALAFGFPRMAVSAILAVTAAVVLVGHMELLGCLKEHADAGGVELCLQRARFRVIAAVDDAGVGLCGTHGHVVVLFKQANRQLILAQFPGHHAADDTGANDRYIINHFRRSLSLT